MTSEKYLLDTDYVIDWLKGRQHAVTFLQRFLTSTQSHSPTLSISIITFAEIYTGIYNSTNPAKQEQSFLDFISFMPVRGITRPIATTYAVIHNDLARKGKLIDQPDLFIAATAVHRNLILVTRNLKDYTRIPQLRYSQEA